MKAYEVAKALSGRDAELPTVSGELAIVNYSPWVVHLLPPHIVPLWKARLQDARDVAVRLGITLEDESSDWPDDLVVEYKLVPVTLGELRKQRPEVAGQRSVYSSG